MMESADPLVLLVLLPTIPVTLISAKMYNWEDSVLLFLRKYCAKIPALSYILPFGRLVFFVSFFTTVYYIHIWD